jgi:hypothetical protein
MRTIAGWFAPLVRTEHEFRQCNLDKEHEAWTWLEAEPLSGKS